MSEGPVRRPSTSSVLVTAAIGLAAVVLLGGPTIFSGLSWHSAKAEQARCAPTLPPLQVSTPELAAQVADALWADPDQADCLLSQHGMTRAEFVALMEAMAQDEAASVAFADARRHPR
jgi:hypothetical protein